MFPILISGTRTSAKMTLIAPQMQQIQEDMRNAMKSGNQMAAEQHAVRYRALLSKHNIKISRQFISIGVQIPLFICYFFAIRGLYNAGLPSLATGGTLWFPNLLIPDPYFILPSTTVISLITH
ncbi:YidC/Oxa1 family membrane protein insertase, partial [Salmonella sp. s51228]|uniref:YidC/Oxa1 family membrane protein insertase n=1 Tax=Salmonella sp. s51228 TaxID=3159652 RepID=UPI00398175AA